MMFRQDSTAEAAFRKEVRTWLDANLPQPLRGRTSRPPPAELMPWYSKLSERGWVAPHWPKAYGGMGATLNEQIILTEELARVAAPQLPAQGLNHIGPILMKFGNDAQKAKHLPPILRGDVIWAQGYSEPGAGSDLASLTTRAVLDGDKFIVNGQKIWQTWGHHSDWMFTLVRTDPNAERKQGGISFLLIKMDSPGLRVRPIITIAGDDELSESFFDDVAVPAENLVGALHGGWAIANDLLSHERLAIANPQYALEAISRIEAIGRSNGTIDDPVFQDRLAGVRIKVVAQAALFSHAANLTASGRHLGAEASILKLVATDNLQAIADLLVEVAGCHGADRDRQPVAGGNVDVTEIFLQCRRATIYGGSSEILRNIVARRVLNLPG
jgi:alkylation response protein AidB-like acyl-CoA dehydrogenase